MTVTKSAASKKLRAYDKVVGAYRDATTGRFTTAESIRSIERNSKRYAVVLKRLAKK